MKKVFTFLAAIVICLAVQGQTVDYELVGFINSDEEVIYDLLLSTDQDLSPRVLLKNNGTGMPAAGDSVIFDIYYNGDLASYFYVMGANLQSIGAGETGIISLPHAMWTAQQMNDYMMTLFQICFEVRIVGSVTDPDASNNEACVQVSRPLGVLEYGKTALKVWPNPVQARVNVMVSEREVEGSELVVYDMYGKCVKREVISSELEYLDVRALAAGFYVLRLERNGKIVDSQKIVKR